MRPSITLAVAAATILIGLGQAAATTTPTYTTIMYEVGSASADIDVSCKDFAITSTGVLSATCNYEDADEAIQTKTATLDLDTVLGCDEYGNLSWTETDFSDESTQVGLELDSTGRDLWVVAICDDGDPPKKDGKALDNGLDNCDGSFGKAGCPTE